MVYLNISVNDLVVTPQELELFKPIIERSFKQDSRWVGGGKPNIEFVRPATLADLKVALVDGNEIEVKRMWYNENVDTL